MVMVKAEYLQPMAQLRQNSSFRIGRLRALHTPLWQPPPGQETTGPGAELTIDGNYMEVHGVKIPINKKSGTRDDQPGPL